MKKLFPSIAVVLLTPAIGAARPSAAVRAACAVDARTHCSAAFGNPDAMRACIREHAAELSSGCRTAIAIQRRAQGGATGRGRPSCEIACDRKCTSMGPQVGRNYCVATCMGRCDMARHGL